jgi:nucleotide-binding universal stress UspA family protein
MLSLKRLLAATDLSAPARHAAERAALVARETGAELELVHVANLDPLVKLRQLVGATPSGLEERLLEAAARQLSELAAALARQRSVTARTTVRSGPVLAELAAQTQASSADLLVLGARGASFMRHYLLGSTAERMASIATRPVLVVKHTAHEGYRTLLVPVDFSPYSARAIAMARAVAPRAEIVLMHAFESLFEGTLRFAGVDDDTVHRYRIAAKDEALRKLTRLRDEAGLAGADVRLLVAPGTAARQIVEKEQESDCDLIVIGQRGESALKELLLGSVTRDVLRDSQSDVLVAV